MENINPILNPSLLLISLFGRNALVPFVADFGAALCFIITGASQSCFSNTWLKIINPYSLLANRILFGKTEFIGFAGYPVQSFQAAIIFAITAGVVSITAMMMLSKRNSYCRERRIKCPDLCMK